MGGRGEGWEDGGVEERRRRSVGSAPVPPGSF